ncbi:MAG: PEP-CTERM sorting domain-containing protein [Rubrivivax sp.]|nr:PEP-CTERM sorting domain-containing protein [Rubrivivax sp.]MDP3615454.1 PEP-CTERM sorting domain-containing protein [Rubrivivax sp.]
MSRSALSKPAFRRLALALVASAAFSLPALADTQVVTFNVLNASATLGTPFSNGDNLRLNTLVTTETGPLMQSITFTVDGSASILNGAAVWEVGTADGIGPRLIGVNLDIFNATTSALVASDSFAGTLAGFATSTFANTNISPGLYRLVATGTGIRESSLDVTVSFIPEPGTYALMLAGLGVVGLMVRRRQA